MKKFFIVIDSILALLIISLSPIKNGIHRFISKPNNFDTQVNSNDKNDSSNINHDSHLNNNDIISNAIDRQKKVDLSRKDKVRVVVNNSTEDYDGHSSLNYGYTITYNDFHNNIMHEAKQYVDGNWKYGHRNSKGENENPYYLGQEDDADNNKANTYVSLSELFNIKIQINGSYQPNTKVTLDSKYKQLIEYQALNSSNQPGSIYYSIEATGILSCPKICLVEHWIDKDTGKQKSSAIGQYGVYNFDFVNGSWAIGLMSTLAPLTLVLASIGAGAIVSYALYKSYEITGIRSFFGTLVGRGTPRPRYIQNDDGDWQVANRFGPRLQRGSNIVLRDYNVGLMRDPHLAVADRAGNRINPFLQRPDNYATYIDGRQVFSSRANWRDSILSRQYRERLSNAYNPDSALVDPDSIWAGNRNRFSIDSNGFDTMREYNEAIINHERMNAKNIFHITRRINFKCDLSDNYASQEEIDYLNARVRNNRPIIWFYNNLPDDIRAGFVDDSEYFAQRIHDAAAYNRGKIEYLYQKYRYNPDLTIEMLEPEDQELINNIISTRALVNSIRVQFPHLIGEECILKDWELIPTNAQLMEIKNREYDGDLNIPNPRLVTTWATRGPGEAYNNPFVGGSFFHGDWRAIRLANNDNADQLSNAFNPESHLVHEQPLAYGSRGISAIDTNGFRNFNDYVVVLRDRIAASIILSKRQKWCILNRIGFKWDKTNNYISRFERAYLIDATSGSSYDFLVENDDVVNDNLVQRFINRVNNSYYENFKKLHSLEIKYNGRSYKNISDELITPEDRAAIDFIVNNDIIIRNLKSKNPELFDRLLELKDYEQHIEKIDFDGYVDECKNYINTELENLHIKYDKYNKELGERIKLLNNLEAQHQLLHKTWDLKSQELTWLLINDDFISTADNMTWQTEVDRLWSENNQIYIEIQQLRERINDIKNIDKREKDAFLIYIETNDFNIKTRTGAINKTVQDLRAKPGSQYAYDAIEPAYLQIRESFQNLTDELLRVKHIINVDRHYTEINLNDFQIWNDKPKKMYEVNFDMINDAQRAKMNEREAIMLTEFQKRKQELELKVNQDKETVERIIKDEINPLNIKYNRMAEEHALLLRNFQDNIKNIEEILNSGNIDKSQSNAIIEYITNAELIRKNLIVLEHEINEFKLLLNASVEKLKNSYDNFAISRDFCRDYFNPQKNYYLTHKYSFSPEYIHQMDTSFENIDSYEKTLSIFDGLCLGEIKNNTSLLNVEIIGFDALEDFASLKSRVQTAIDQFTINNSIKGALLLRLDSINTTIIQNYFKPKDFILEQIQTNLTNIVRETKKIDSIRENINKIERGILLQALRLRVNIRSGNVDDVDNLMNALNNDIMSIENSNTEIAQIFDNIEKYFNDIDTHFVNFEYDKTIKDLQVRYKIDNIVELLNEGDSKIIKNPVLAKINEVFEQYNSLLEFTKSRREKTNELSDVRTIQINSLKPIGDYEDQTNNLIKTITNYHPDLLTRMYNSEEQRLSKLLDDIKNKHLYVKVLNYSEFCSNFSKQFNDFKKEVVEYALAHIKTDNLENEFKSKYYEFFEKFEVYMGEKNDFEDYKTDALNGIRLSINQLDSSDLENLANAIGDEAMIKDSISIAKSFTDLSEWWNNANFVIDDVEAFMGLDLNVILNIDSDIINDYNMKDLAINSFKSVLGDHTNILNEFEKSNKNDDIVKYENLLEQVERLNAETQEIYHTINHTRPSQIVDSIHELIANNNDFIITELDDRIRPLHEILGRVYTINSKVNELKKLFEVDIAETETILDNYLIAIDDMIKNHEEYLLKIKNCFGENDEYNLYKENIINRLKNIKERINSAKNKIDDIRPNFYSIINDSDKLLFGIHILKDMELADYTSFEKIRQKFLDMKIILSKNETVKYKIDLQECIQNIEELNTVYNDIKLSNDGIEVNVNKYKKVMSDGMKEIEAAMLKEGASKGKGVRSGKMAAIGELMNDSNKKLIEINKDNNNIIETLSNISKSQNKLKEDLETIIHNLRAKKDAFENSNLFTSIKNNDVSLLKEFNTVILEYDTIIDETNSAINRLGTLNDLLKEEIKRVESFSSDEY